MVPRATAIREDAFDAARDGMTRRDEGDGCCYWRYLRCAVVVADDGAADGAADSDFLFCHPAQCYYCP